MSSDALLPATAVPLDIEDPVQKARAELKAALAAIEHKANVPKRVAVATERRVERVRTLARKNPAAVAAAVAGVALTVGATVWALVRVYTR